MSSEKWTEIEHLPEWDEEFYEVYTARKHGKWVMLKTLKPELRDTERGREMIEKEFDVRYNLAHPNIIMINDFEEVPGLGYCIITDDVYGDSLRKLIDNGEVNEDILNKIVTRLPEAISYIQTNHIVHHPLRPETIIFTEKIHNLKVIDVGYDQHEALSPAAANDDIRNFGNILMQTLNAMGDKAPQRLVKIAERCLTTDVHRQFRDVTDLKLALAGDNNKRLYITAIIFLTIMTLVLAWLCIKAPAL